MCGGEEHLVWRALNDIRILTVPKELRLTAMHVNEGGGQAFFWLLILPREALRELSTPDLEGMIRRNHAEKNSYHSQHITMVSTWAYLYLWVPSKSTQVWKSSSKSMVSFKINRFERIDFLSLFYFHHFTNHPESYFGTFVLGNKKSLRVK